MNCKDWSQGLKLWLAERWGDEATPTEPPEGLADHAGICASCARKLQAALLLMGGTGLRAPAPSGLPERVVSRLELQDARRLRILRRFRILRPGPAPRGARVAARVLLPAAAALVAALAVFVALRLAGPPEPVLVRVVLVLEAPKATQVSVVGDWNAWDPEANPLSDPDGDGVWTVELRVHRGAELRYQFLIDNQTWVPDPQAPFQVDDGFGGRASILQT